VSVTLGQYGDLTELSDRVEDLSEDPVLNDMVEAMSRQIAETKERITWAAIIAGTNVYYSSTAGSPSSRSDVNDTISLSIQRAITRSLKNQRAMKLTRKLSAGPNFATEPVAPSYVAVCHSDCETDIRNLPGFVPTENYANGSQLHDWELGKKEDVRYITSPVLVPWYSQGSATLNGMSATDATNVDVYPIVYLSEKCFGTVPLRGPGSTSPYVQNPGQRSKSDPLGQRGYVGWKMYFAALILNEAWINRAEVGVTDLP
jgi:N4-gp56 family major capsid protein